MTNAVKSKRRGFIRKRDYILTDADPIVNTVRSAYDVVGRPKIAQIVRDTRLSPSTIKRLLDGDTRRPQHTTTSLVMTKSFGYKEVFQPAQKGSRLPIFFVEVPVKDPSKRKKRG